MADGMNKCSCGGDLIGDGYSSALHCECADESTYEYHAPDEGPVECDFAALEERVAADELKESYVFPNAAGIIAERAACIPNVESGPANLPPPGTLVEVDLLSSSRPRQYTWRGKVERTFEADTGTGLVVSDGEYLQHLWPGSVHYRVVRFPGEEFDCVNAKWRAI